MKTFDRELVSGSIYRSVWKLAWPLVLLNLVNGAHALVDHILVGHFVASPDNAANAAIGVAWQVFLVVVVFIASLFHGANVMIARYAGRQDRDTINRVFYQTFSCSLLILVGVVAPLGYLCAPLLLDFVHAAPAVQQHALPYLRILFSCGAPLFLMYMITGAFQASGDPRTPLKLAVLCTALNVVISTVLITGLGPFPALGASGAALGTVLAPCAGVGIAVWLILRRKMLLQPPDRLSLKPDLAVLRMVARIGIPTGIQGVLLNIGGVFLMKFIGALEHSAAAQAAYTICYAQLFSLITWTAFGLRAAAGTVMGQNIGAGDPKRGKAGVAVAAYMGAVWAACIGVAFWVFPSELLALFNAVGEPLHGYSISLLRYLSISGVMLAATLGLTGGIQGAGYTKIPMYIAFFTQIVVLLGICSYFLARGTLDTEKVWLAILLSHTSRLALTYAVFRTEHWAHTQVELGEV